MEEVALVPLNPPARSSFAPHAHWNGSANASSVLKLWHLASLDAPTVAVTWALAFGWAAGVRPDAWPLVILGLVVWVIYVVDRLLDARAGLAHSSANLLQQRHHFHWRNRRVLVPLCVCATAAAAWMVLTRMPVWALRSDSLVGVATVAYMFNVHGRKNRAGQLRGFAGWMSRLVPRECAVGLMFSAGCLLPVIARTKLDWAVALPAIAFAGLAWLNVGAIGEWESCRENGGQIRRAAIALSCGCLAAAAALAFTRPASAEVVLASSVSALLLAALDGRAAVMEPVILRAAADLVLLTPLVLLAARAVV